MCISSLYLYKNHYQYNFIIVHSNSFFQLEVKNDLITSAYYIAEDGILDEIISRKAAMLDLEFNFRLYQMLKRGSFAKMYQKTQISKGSLNDEVKCATLKKHDLVLV